MTNFIFSFLIGQNYIYIYREHNVSMKEIRVMLIGALGALVKESNVVSITLELVMSTR